MNTPTIEELFETFKPVAVRLRNEGNSTERIADVFNTYVHARIHNLRVKERRRTLRDAEELGI